MQETELQTMQDSRLISMAEHLLYPTLAKLIAEKVNEATHKFRAGKDATAELAYISAIQDIEQRFKHIQLKGNKIYANMEEQHGNTDPSNRSS
jgi:hypothetical protein